MNTKNEIISFLQDNRIFLSNQFYITKIGLFGSFARNEQTDTSDVDLLIELENGTQNIHELKTSLKKFLSKAFNRNVDIARVKYLKPYAKKLILKDTIYI